MKRVTETDIVALRARSGRTPKPKTKKGMDGMVQMAGNSFVCTKESLDILTYAGQCHGSFYSFCQQADRPPSRHSLRNGFPTPKLFRILEEGPDIDILFLKFHSLPVLSNSNIP